MSDHGLSAVKLLRLPQAAELQRNNGFVNLVKTFSRHVAAKGSHDFFQSRGGGDGLGRCCGRKCDGGRRWPVRRVPAEAMVRPYKDRPGAVLLGRTLLRSLV